jgi:virulence-associated protein VapD
MFNIPMKKISASHKPLLADYRRLLRRLGQLGYLSQGSVFQRTPPQQGSRYIWTRKVQAKTVTVALSEQQYHWLRQAIANQRELDRIVDQMQKLSRQVLFDTVPGVARRKRLSKKVLGLI